LEEAKYEWCLHLLHIPIQLIVVLGFLTIYGHVDPSPMIRPVPKGRRQILQMELRNRFEAPPSFERKKEHGIKPRRKRIWN
jgi:hypothetical protein